ncbi:MAG TPA: redoxin domain-containing protein [Candidatus Paceibacterota bacterium]|nr:redoxin domain-containing protein [Candidatus Paceibacterota bacterium]
MAKEQKSNYCEQCGDFHDAYHEYLSSVKIGEAIPDYEFQAFQKEEAKTMKFSDFRGKWLVIMFYPGDFTFVCPTELEEMAGAYPKIKEMNADVVSFSTDTVFVHKAWHDTSPAVRKIDFPMGADPSGKIASAFGVLIEGGDLPFVTDEGQALRGTFIVDPNGILRTMEVHDNSVGRAASETVRKLKAAQFVEANPGMVCPAAWDEGDEGMTPGMDKVGKI